MISASNIVVLTGNMTADPESPKDNIMKFRLAVNAAGYGDGEVSAGFFDVTVFYNGMSEGHAEFIKRQLASGNFAKGTRVSVTGSLRHERWKAQDGTNRERVSIVASSVDYAGGRQQEDSGERNPVGTGRQAAVDEGPGLPTTF